MRTPLQTRSTSSADRMLEATLELLEAGGLQAVTVAAVAQHARTSNGSLYHRFGDRAGLLRAAQER
ncbi:helix-turn-helix domain-containing protein, partial [Nocardioides hankookensis]